MNSKDPVYAYKNMTHLIQLYKIVDIIIVFFYLYFAYFNRFESHGIHQKRYLWNILWIDSSFSSLFDSIRYKHTFIHKGLKIHL